MGYPVTLLMVSAIVLGASGCSRKMYFHSLHYPNGGPTLPKRCAALNFVTSQGRQEAFYLAPAGASERPPEKLWFFFGGNASVALGWAHLITSLREPRAGFLLFEYPGSGRCEGRPTRRSLDESARGALEALADHLGVRDDYFDKRLNLLGHSLGCAVALDLAAARPVERIVLLAPFTSLSDMAMPFVGWPLCLMVPDRFDNEARLRELYHRRNRPVVVMIHGSDDWVVPVWMSRKLAQNFPDWIAYDEIPGGTHNSILNGGAASIARAMFPERRMTSGE